jgi:hypothetical protein
MTSRKRVRATVRGLPVDRVPVITWLTPHAACRMMAEFHPATDPVRNAACRLAWEDFSKNRGSPGEDLRAFMPLLYTGVLRLPRRSDALPGPLQRAHDRHVPEDDGGGAYVEAELDILQSFQPKAGNDFQAAHREYGDRLTFCTGVDVQRGELMTPEELGDDILRAYRIGGRNGRHVLGYTHMLQYTMPAENLETLLRTVREIQQGLCD